MPKLTTEDRLNALGTALRAVRPEVANALLADAMRAAKRAARGDAVPAGYERVELVQAKGPTLAFAGKLLAETTWETRGADPVNVTLELYETPAGNWIAATAFDPVGRDRYEDVSAAVIERQDDVQAMRIAVLEHFQWHERARSMLRKQLDWPAVVVEVD